MNDAAGVPAGDTDAGSAPPAETERPAGSVPMAPPVTMDMLRWHLDRYDRLRASTASRASVVLSAGALLFAGDAVVFSQLVGGSVVSSRPWALACFTIAALTSAALVVLSVLRASSVLVTPRHSRAVLGDRDVLPVGPVFNGTDTVAHVPTFAAFRALLEAQPPEQARAAAQVELWIGIHQHRQRYVRLRESVRLLRYAAITLLVLLTAAMVANLLLRL